LDKIQGSKFVKKGGNIRKNDTLGRL